MSRWSSLLSVMQLLMGFIFISNVWFQVFDLVNRESYNPSPGVNVISTQEDRLNLSIGQETSVSFCLLPFVEEETTENRISSTDSLGLMTVDENNDSFARNYLNLPDPVNLEIFLQQLFHENVFSKSRGRRSAAGLPVPGHITGDGCNILGHFCVTIAHRIFSRKVMCLLEGLVRSCPYLIDFLHFI